MARNTVNQRAQYGKESTAGTVVPAGKRPTSGTLTLTSKSDKGEVRPAGSYFPTSTYLKKEWCEGKFDGTPDFNEIGDVLELAFGAPSVSTASGSTTRTFKLSQTRGSWTVELGDDTAASVAAGVFAKSIELAWGRNSGDATLSMDLIGAALQDGHVLTAGAVGVSPAPVTAQTVKVYVDGAREDLGTTELSKALSVNVKLDAIADAAWYLNGSGSFSDTVNTVPASTVTLLCEADADGRAFIDDLRSGDTRYVRVEATGVGGRKLTIDLALQVETSAREDSNAIWAANTTLKIVEDADGFSHSVALVTPAA